jgi:gamma-glutamyl-gamma-aminobutyrate hydrolase PuuD
MERRVTLKSDLVEIMKRFPGSVIATTACLGGELSTSVNNMLAAEAVFDMDTRQKEHDNIVQFILFCKDIFGDDFYVNSIHNVKVKTLADCFKVSALSPDGVIEAYEHKTLPIYCFQWHPERMRGDFPDMPYGPDTDVLFDTFIEMCK